MSADPDRAVSAVVIRVGGEAKARVNERLSQVIGIDPVEAYTELANLKTAYEGALQVTAGALTGAKLFDFLR